MEGAPSERAALATPEQLAAERLTLELLRHPAILAAQNAVRPMIEADPAAGTASGKAVVERALQNWTVALCLQSIGDPQRPAFLWWSEDTPHRWHGIDFPGSGAAGDNPDHIYQTARIDGDRQYVIEGRVPVKGPVQFSFDLMPDFTDRLEDGEGRLSLFGHIAVLKDRDMAIDADGRFQITVGPESSDDANHLQSQPGGLQVLVRHVLGDWRHAPVSLSIRLSGEPAAPPPDPDWLARRVATGLPGFVRLWLDYLLRWLDKPTANVMAGPIARDGGWGYIGGTRFDLGPDEALVFTMRDEGARYVGVQMSDAWFITPDSRSVFTSRNMRQREPNPDGSATYVLAHRDPGMFNWIETDGQQQGFLLLRWQQVPGDADPARMQGPAQLVSFDRIAALMPPAMRRVTHEERAAERLRRKDDQEYRLWA